MNLLTNLRIGHRLGIAFAISIAISMLLAGYARTSLIRINDELALMVENRLVKAQQLEQIKDNVNITALSVRNTLLVPDAASKRKQLDEVERVAKLNADIFEKLNASIQSDKGRELMKAGLDSIPGGGGVNLVQRGRDNVARKKAGGDRWLVIMEVADGKPGRGRPRW